MPETKQIVDAGGLIIEVLASKVATTQPTEADLRAWVTTEKLVVHSLIDPPGSANVTLNGNSPPYPVDIPADDVISSRARAEDRRGRRSTRV